MEITSNTKNRRTQAERREEAEQRLIAAAISLIAEKGYHRYSLADVGRLAGYSRGLAGHYFGAKEELQKSVAHFIMNEFYNEVAQLPVRDNGLPTLEALIRYYVEVSSKNQRARVLTVLLAEAQTDPMLHELLSSFQGRALRVLEFEIDRGKKLGNIRAEVNTKAQAGIIYTFLRGQLSFVSYYSDDEHQEMTEQFLENLRTNIGV